MSACVNEVMGPYDAIGLFNKHIVYMFPIYTPAQKAFLNQSPVTEWIFFIPKSN